MPIGRMHRGAVFFRVGRDQRIGRQIAAQARFAEQRKEALQSCFPSEEQLHMVTIQPLAHGRL